MNDKEVLTEAEEQRGRQSSLLSKFEEIARNFPEPGWWGARKRQGFYLPPGLSRWLHFIKRRSLQEKDRLLAIHDLKEELEAPPTLGSMTLSKLALWNVRPLPQVTFYSDIATAILRMEVVIRLEAMQALVESPFLA